MIDVQIDKTTLLNLLMDRLEYWTDNHETLELYGEYLEDLIDSGYFENNKLDVMSFIDNLYINYTTVTDKEGLINNYNIEPDDCGRILANNEDKNLYLISTY